MPYQPRHARRRPRLSAFVLGLLAPAGLVLSDEPAAAEPAVPTPTSSKATATRSTPGPAPEASPSADLLASASRVNGAEPPAQSRQPEASGQAEPPGAGGTP